MASLRWKPQQVLDTEGKIMDDKQRSEFVDLIGFWIALACYAEAISDEEYRKDVVLQGAMPSLYRFQDLVAQGIDNILIPACQDSPYLQRFVSRLDRASRKGKSLELAIVQGRVLRDFMSVLRGHTDKIRDIFPGPRESQAAVKIAAAAAADDGVQTLRMLATIPPASSIRVIRKWILEALNRLGAAPSEVEVVLAESSEASSLGSELRQIESVLDKMDPTSADAASLTQKREDVITRIQSVVAASNSPEVVMSTAVSAASGSKEYATKIGAELRLNPDKERCVMLRGKGIIAAGAGSGKTLTLAAKVLYHMKELGVPPSGIIATSFSRKSAAELIHRINKYGGDIDPRNTTGFGTTHSIAVKLMREYGYPTREELAAYESTDLITMAIKQVQLGPFNIPAPEPQSIFFRPAPPPVAPPTTRISPSLGFKGALESAFASRHRLNSFARSFIEGFFNPRDPYYTSTMRKTRNLTDHSGLTDKQKAVLQRIFDQAGVEYSLYASKTASDDKADRYRFWSTPANQWFNLGLTLEDEKGQPLPRGNFSRAITKYKGRAISPTEAFTEASGDPELEGHAAVYAAYEFLKGPEGEPTLAGKGDFDDLLLDMSKMMLSSPDILRKIRSRFKTVLVDEAQDLNRTQHLMFGLISGYVNPDNVPKIATARSMGELAYPNGEMTADTYTLIGDDKQAIYAFRGADPEAFIDMSDLVEGGAGFKTEILKTNYRSGEAIVSAANHLISHNLKQIPMACNANPDRVDKGGVNIIPFSPAVAGDFSEPADWFARQIEDTMAVSDQGEAGYNNFGIGLRTGAEAYFYGMALLMRGIPFRSNLNFFTDKNAKALLAWLTIVDEGLDGNTERINASVLEARIAPGSMLGPTFVERLTQRASGNYIKWLSGNAASIYGPGSKYTAYVNTFTDNLLLATSWKGLGAEEALVKVLGLEGVGGQSITSTMIESVRNNEEIMAELRAESEGGDVSNEDIAARALAPIRPLNVILKSRSDLTECMTFTRQLQSANDKLAAKDDPDAKGFNQPAVTLGTMHSWKGLEVPVMFVPFVGGKFPRASSDRELEDERRLAYVAITRGQNQVYVMDIPQVIGPKRSSSIVHSQFVHEICAPTTPPEGALRLASSDFVDIPSGWSPMEEDAMDAFLRGEDPMLMTSYSGWGDVMYGEVE
jgi:superfamily I DNA/RNA helicase